MAAPPPDVAILGGSREGWHGARLRQALEGLGLAVEPVPFEGCGFRIGGVIIHQRSDCKLLIAFLKEVSGLQPGRGGSR